MSTRANTAPTATPGPPADPPPRRRAPLLAAVATWGYLAAMLALLLATRLVGERAWPGVFLIFFKRWLYLAPLVPVLALITWARSRRLLAAWGATGLLVLGPIMVPSLPLASWFRPPPRGPTIRVLTLNRGGSLDYDTLNDLIDEQHLDVLCFQEFTRYNDSYVRKLAPGFHWTSDRRIASRFPVLAEEIAEVPRPGPDFDRAFLTLATIRTPDGPPARVACLDMPSMTRPLWAAARGRIDPAAIERHVAWRRTNLAAVLHRLARETGPLILAGDLNTPPDSDLLRPLRRRFRFAFERAGWGYGYTWTVGRPMMRIDHILATPDWAPTTCRVGPPVGSDHFPVWAELVLTRPRGNRRLALAPPAPARVIW